ncbi:hypothetical protein JW960_07045 [candidate division KSB1 bacterium]|nr:hypothetical protein [candidate division KSB1 bacterium]
MSDDIGCSDAIAITPRLIFSTLKTLPQNYGSIVSDIRQAFQKSDTLLSFSLTFTVNISIFFKKIPAFRDTFGTCVQLNPVSQWWHNYCRKPDE